MNFIIYFIAYQYLFNQYSLKQAHQQGRKADMLVKSGKYEEAVTCHNRAAGLLVVLYFVEA